MPAVAHVGPTPGDGGGMASVMTQLAAADAAAGRPTTLIRTHQVGDPLRRHGRFACGLAALAVFCLRPGPRLVHVHATVRGSMYRKAVCVALARGLRTPVVLHVHGGALELERFHASRGPVSRWLFAAAMRLAGRVVTVSAAGARVLERSYGACDVDVLPNPVGPLRAGPVPDDAPPDVLYLGGFANPVKGGAIMLAALPALLAAHPGAVVDLAGHGVAPPEAARLPGVRLRGWIDADAKATAMRRARVVVLPSLSEGLPVVLLEAMALGRAVVATRVGGIPEVVEDGYTGVLVDPGDPGALAAAVAALLDDPARAAALGTAAQEAALAFAPERVAGLVTDLYRSLTPA